MINQSIKTFLQAINIRAWRVIKSTKTMNKMATVEKKGRRVKEMKGGMVTMPFIFGKVTVNFLSSFLTRL